MCFDIILIHPSTALDSCTDSHICLEHFLGWDAASQEEEDDMIDIKEENTQSGYQKLVEFLLTNQVIWPHFWSWIERFTLGVIFSHS